MGNQLKRKGRVSLRETVIIIVVLCLLTLLALPVVRNTMSTNLSRTCEGNLKEWGSIFAMYQVENHSYNPPPHGYETFGTANNEEGCRNIDDKFDFAPDVRLIFPEYANDPLILACPRSAGAIPPLVLGNVVIQKPSLDPVFFGIAEGWCKARGSITRPGAAYTYLGFGTKYVGDQDPQITLEQAQLAGLPATGPANLVALVKQFEVNMDTTLEQAQSKRTTNCIRDNYMQPLGSPFTGSDLDHSLLGPLNTFGAKAAGSSAVNGVGIDYSDIIAAYPKQPVMWDAIYQDAVGDAVFNHTDPYGCNVLFLDGHVEFKTFPGEFPVSKSFAAMRAVAK